LYFLINRKVIQLYNIKNIRKNNYMNKGLIVLAIGSIVAAVFSFYQLSQHRKKKAVQ